MNFSATKHVLVYVEQHLHAKPIGVEGDCVTHRGGCSPLSQIGSLRALVSLYHQK